MTYEQAVAHADKRAKATGELRYVVREAGEYHIATEYDMDTFFDGIGDANILYCTADAGVN